MRLRSGRIINEFPSIDFDNSSKMWRRNKLYLGYGQFKYIKKYYYF